MSIKNKAETETCTDYQGEARDLCDCVEITIGDHEGELILSSESLQDEQLEVYPANMDGLGEYVMDYDGSLRLTRDCSLLTAGDSEGKWALDEETQSYGGDVFLSDEMDEAGYCLDYCGDIQLWEDCFLLTSGRYEGEYAHADDCSHWGEECWLGSEGVPDGIVVLGNGEYASADDCSYCESCDEYYLDDDGECCPEENNESEDHINEYHSSPSPCRYGDYRANAIGFEVEKKEIEGKSDHGDYVGTRPLFSGVETDSSCGVEAISHIYALNNEGQAIFEDHCERSRDWLGEETDNSCGGHVNISGDNITLEKIRRYAGLFYALYRFRLNNSYACRGKDLKGSSERYCPIRMKRTGLAEFRLVSRVKSAGQLKWRFRLFRLLVECIDQDKSFRHFMDCARPLIREAYPSPAKRVEIRQLAKHFDNYLQNGVIHPSISNFI